MLAAVLREARETLGRSPEQVGTACGVSGRTIRRLEEPGSDTANPRGTTLDALAAFYGLRQSFVRLLADWADLAGPELNEAVLAEAVDTLGLEGDDLMDDEVDYDALIGLAMRMARGSAPRPGELGPEAAPAQQLFVSFTRGQGSWDALKRDGESEDAIALLNDFLALDRPRQRTLRALAADLRAAGEHERDRERRNARATTGRTD